MFAKYLAAVALSSFVTVSSGYANDRPPQYVLISFDGAGPIEQWIRSRQLAADAEAEFTYFLSCVYVLTSENRRAYQAPGSNGPKSNVGYANSREDVAARLDQIWRARAEGHEIASHGCGHLDGADWSVADWNQEFAEFTKILRDAWKINGIDGEPDGWITFAENEVKGFRAPYLSYSDNLFRAEAESGLLYDASTVSSGPAPIQRRDGIYRFSLPLIPEGPSSRPVIAMDYNLHVRHSGAKEEPEHGSLFEQRAYDAFMAVFNKEYAADRTPLQIGLHFTLMNEGAYWRALERFAKHVCTRDDVRCVSNLRYLEETEPEMVQLRGSVDG